MYEWNLAQERKKVNDALSEASSLLQKLLYTLPVDILYRQMSPLMAGYDLSPKAVPLYDSLWNIVICTAQHYFSHFDWIRYLFFVCVGQTIQYILVSVTAQTKVDDCSPPGDQFALTRLITYLQIVVGMAAVQQVVTYSSHVSV
jgi:hypothetical protein